MPVIVSGVPISTLWYPIAAVVIGVLVPVNKGKVVSGCLWCLADVIEMIPSPNLQPLEFLGLGRESLAGSASSALGGPVSGLRPFD